MSCIFQSVSQMENRYPYNAWQEILGACDVQLFLGCTDKETAAFVSDRTGIATVQVESEGKQLNTWQISSYTPDYRRTSSVGKRMVMTPDEVLRLPPEKALIMIRGHKVLMVDKFDYTRHPEAKRLKSIEASQHIPIWAVAPHVSNPAKNMSEQSVFNRTADTLDTIPLQDNKDDIFTENGPALPDQGGFTIVPMDKESII